MKNEMLIQAGMLFVTVFLMTVALEARLVPWLRSRKAGQPILEIGPAWHMSKTGTPTLGGLGFIVAALLGGGCFLVIIAAQDGEAWRLPLLVILFAGLCGAIGFFDDWRKLTRRENKGLSAPQKYFLQLLVCAAFLLAAEWMIGLDKSIALPFGGGELNLGILYYPVALLYLTGIVNALNLTDGVDGLLSSVTGVFAAFLLLWGCHLANFGAIWVAALLLGAVLGFLCFNAHPAKVFMGDTGSLFLGGVVGGYGILSPSPLTVLIACGVFVLEAASVLLQVIWFKFSGGKRLFRMAPLHHHFEKCGWSEERVVAIFCAVGALCGLLAFFWGIECNV